MIDPRIWAETPGQGRAPLLAPPQRPAQVTADPRADIVRLLQGATDNRTRPGDMPVGMMVRPPSSMSIDEMVMEERALGGPMGYAGNVGATLASGGTLGVGTGLGLMGRAGVGQRQRQLSPEIENRLGAILATGAPTPVTMRPQGDSGVQITRRAVAPVADPVAAAYEAGRQAAVGYRREPEQRGGGDARDRGGRSTHQGGDVGAGGWAGGGGL